MKTNIYNLDNLLYLLNSIDEYTFIGEENISINVGRIDYYLNQIRLVIYYYYRTDEIKSIFVNNKKISTNDLYNIIIIKKRKESICKII